MLAIHGLGGTGKTQIALQFAYWVKENDPQCSVFWVSAMSKATFTQDCSHIASKLSILSDQNKDKDVKDLVKEYLSSETAGRWLLIVDNVDDANIFSPSPDQSMHLVHFLPESPNGQVLCTTRFRHIATDLGCSEIIQLNQMSKEDSLDFLRKSLSEEKLLCDASITDQLLTELELIPLAIAQAAAYIARNSVSISEYLELLRNTHEDMSELMSAEFTDLTRPQSTSNAIANTWILSFERIRQTDQTAADLLAFVSYIEPKAIPRSILPPPPSKTRLVSAIGTLLGYAFFTKRDDNTYDMHRLVQKATKIWLDKHPLVKEEARKEAVEHLADVFPDAQDSYDNIPMCREYLPHALKIAQSAQGEDLDSHYTLCELLGHFFIWDGRLQECIYWREQVFKWRKEMSGEDDAATLDSEFDLACACSRDGRIGRAIKLLEHVVAIQSKMLREDHSDRLGSEHELASAYLADGRIGAIKLLAQVVAIRSKVVREDHSDRLGSEYELARAHLADGRIGEAIELFERVVAIRSKVVREDHPNYLASQHELANAYLADGRIGEAIKLLAQVVAIRSKVVREDHSDRLGSEHELARAHLANGFIGEAIELFERVVAIRSKVLREDHPNYLASRHELARAYFADGRIGEAIELLEPVVAIQSKMLQEDHSDRLGSEHVLATAYFKDGRVDEAIELMEHVVSIQRTSLLSGHPHREGSEAWLAYMHSGADITRELPWHDEMSSSFSSPPKPPPLRLDEAPPSSTTPVIQANNSPDHGPEAPEPAQKT
ncbi:TPR-like protein [Trichodelitschia bisporula]|uniref:TPR-like protein n=1 Tax=Trichodelitschia bisporula TaxID=703511 RepID=A0A6G1I5M9_9PEZI|nr:TPR-like protein [Trichodelitschia bisporula]